MSPSTQGRLNGPVEIADRVYWVASMLPNDQFQCHSYLIEAGDASVLIDPGSALTIESVLKNAAQVVDLASIRWIVCHHPDPDVCGGLTDVEKVVSSEAVIVTEWRAAALLRHYASRLPFYLVEKHDWSIPLDEDRRLEFVLTPYLHFPGALCSYETGSQVLFSCDLFGGFTDGSSLYAADDSYFDAIRSFHEHYMPSGEILRAGLNRLRRRWPDVTTTAPQHGCVIRSSLVSTIFDRLEDLECGVFLMARDDIDLAALLQASAVERDLRRALLSTSRLDELMHRATVALSDILPIETIEIYVTTLDEGTLRFASDNEYRGNPCGSMPPENMAPSLQLPSPDGGPPAWAFLILSGNEQVPSDLARMLVQLAAPLRVAVDRDLAHRRELAETDRILGEALHDPLTGLNNRRILDNLVATDHRNGLLLLDVDNFKAINDHCGHDAGDDALRKIANIITANIRSRSDFGIRYGGDEFLVILQGTDEFHTARIAERIRQQIELLPPLQGLAGNTGALLSSLSVSIGAAMQQVRQDLVASIATADAALYRSKQLGRNRITCGW